MHHLSHDMEHLEPWYGLEPEPNPSAQVFQVRDEVHEINHRDVVRQFARSCSTFSDTHVFDIKSALLLTKSRH